MLQVETQQTKIIIATKKSNLLTAAPKNKMCFLIANLNVRKKQINVTSTCKKSRISFIKKIILGQIMERNYKEDQSNEVEALDSIYCGEMEILTEEPFHKFTIPIATQEYSNEDQTGLTCRLVFTYTEKYPDTAPLVEIEDPVNFEDGYEKQLLEHINNTITENIGMEMIFSVCSSAQEWLNLRWDDYKTEEENERVKKLQEIEELERKKFEGTRVNVETFLKWRTEFEEDMGIAAKREKTQGENKKLTGRELFMRDNTLNESDIKFLMDNGDTIESVKIDESLFQNLDDLELDSDDDDEDYVPGKDID